MKEQQYSPYNDGMSSENKSDHLLDQILETDAMPPLPDNFADRIAYIAVRRFTLKQSIFEFLIYTTAVIIIGLVFIGILYFTNSGEWIGWLQFFTSRINLMAGISLILFFIFFADIVLFPWLFLRLKQKINKNVQN